MGNIITVSREFGSGGRELGKRLADELGYRYYDREIVTALSEQTGMDPNFLDHQLESSSARVRYPIHFAQSFSQIAAVSDTAMHILSLETKLIRELAAKDDCIFVGRAADALLEEQNPFKLFVYADEASKLARCRSRAIKLAAEGSTIIALGLRPSKNRSKSSAYSPSVFCRICSRPDQ